MTPCTATLTDAWSSQFAPPPSYVIEGMSSSFALKRRDPFGGFESRRILKYEGIHWKQGIFNLIKSIHEKKL